MPVGRFRGARADRIDDDDLGAARCASRTSGQQCRFVTIVFVPHSTMNRLWTICSGSMPVPQPIVADSPAAATAPQILDRPALAAAAAAPERRATVVRE